MLTVYWRTPRTTRICPESSKRLSVQKLSRDDCDAATDLISSSMDVRYGEAGQCKIALDGRRIVRTYPSLVDREDVEMSFSSMALCIRAISFTTDLAFTNPTRHSGRPFAQALTGVVAVVAATAVVVVVAAGPGLNSTSPLRMSRAQPTRACPV